MTYNRDRKNEIISFLSINGQESFTAEEICERLLADGGGKSTVYRILSGLVKDGTVKRISDGKSRHVRYQYLGEKRCAEHLHLKCRLCGRLIHLDRATSELILGSLERCGGFSLDPTEILSGSCEDCKELN